jgi:hypothetical protein
MWEVNMSYLRVGVSLFLSLVLVFSLVAQQTATAPLPVPAKTSVLYLTLGSDGFDQASLTIPSGRVLLALANHSGVSGVVLQLNQQTANGLVAVALDAVQSGRRSPTGPQVPSSLVSSPREKRDWRAVQNLPAGQYILTEASHPNWVCHITVIDNPSN